MKQILTFLFLLIIFVACNKKNLTPTPIIPNTPVVSDSCKCGIVQDSWYDANIGKWWIVVVNNCTQNENQFLRNIPFDNGSVLCAETQW